MYFIYTLIYSVVIFFLLPFEFFKRPRDLRMRWLREKFGFWEPAFEFPDSPGYQGGRSGTIWVHAVSVGEVIAASPLIGKIRERYPSKEIVLSTITDTGRQVARERTPGDTRIVYLPFDIPFALNSVLLRSRPELLIIIETELWPNMFRTFGGRGIPIVLLNGRISEKSFRGYKRVSFFMRKVLSNVNFFGTQGEVYADRIRGLGVDGARVKSLGNLKFDSRPASRTPAWAARLIGPVITAGSTHEGEEELMVYLYTELRKDFPDLNFVIAPRHPERFKVVEEMLRSRGVPFLKRSSLDTTAAEAAAIKGCVILLDTVGELSSVYGMTDIAIIGKSFNGHGGQNPLEPASWGRPFICGPHMENFPVIRDFYEAGAAVEAKKEDLYAQVKQLLLCPDEARKMGLRAQELYRKNSGAVDRAMEVLSGYIT